MNNIFISAILFLAVIAQTSLFPNFFPVGSIPDVALLIIIIWTVRSDFHAVFKWAIIGGFFLDMASFRPVGISIIAFVAAAFITNSLRKRFLTPQLVWRSLIFCVIIAIATILNQAIILLLMQKSIGLGGLHGFIEDYAKMILGKEVLLRMICNIAIFSILYRPLSRAEKILAYYKK